MSIATAAPPLGRGRHEQTTGPLSHVSARGRGNGAASGRAGGDLKSAQALIFATLLTLVCTPSAAEGHVRIVRYVLEVAPTGEVDGAHFHLELRYAATGETKNDGFKFVGEHAPGTLRAYDGTGK